MHKAVRDIADLLDALESVGLTKAVGPKFKAFCKNYVMRRADGVYLKCTTTAGKSYNVP